VSIVHCENYQFLQLFSYKILHTLVASESGPAYKTSQFLLVVYRLEEKEQEQKREYAKLHERYTELFKTHMDYMERTKILMGSAERLEGASRGRLPTMNLAQLNRCEFLTFNF
jgi:hypothetical protein